jgi:hypothetical protein
MMIGFGVTLGVSGGYAVQAFGWRLPPNLEKMAQPMTTFVRNLTRSRLARLVATSEEPPARPLPPDGQRTAGLSVKLAEPMSAVSTATAPEEIERMDERPGRDDVAAGPTPSPGQAAESSSR